MVAYVFFRKEVAIPRLEVLKEEARRQAERCNLKEQEWWWDCRDDDIVFVFAKGDKGRHAANIFIFNCKLPCRADWSESFWSDS